MDRSWSTPSWDELVKLMLSQPKPPMRCRVVETRHGSLFEESAVLHDGDAYWLIRSRDRTVVSTPGRTLINRREGLEVFESKVASNNRVKTMLQPNLIAYLEEGTGAVVAKDLLGGHACWVCEVGGLRRDHSSSLRLWVEIRHGVIMRIESEVGEFIVTVKDLEWGKLEESDS